MLDRYKLSETQHHQIFEKICHRLFKNKTPVKNPQIFILGGQPAAGKSILTQRVMNEFEDTNIVVINADEFRLNHPDAKEIFKLYDKDFAQYTDPDVRLWGSEVFEAAIDGRYNIIFEGTMRTTQICDTIKRLQSIGYKINILAMAVPEIKSRISIYARYQQQLENYPIARFTSQFAHDNAYHGMLDTLKKIEEENLYDTITIYNRAGDIVFKNGDQDIVAAVLNERNKPLTEKENNELLKNCTDLIKKMCDRHEDSQYIEDLEQLRTRLLNDNFKKFKNTASLCIQKAKKKDTIEPSYPLISQQKIISKSHIKNNHQLD